MPILVLVHAGLGVQEDPKSSFHHWAVLVNLWHGIFSTRKDIEVFTAMELKNAYFSAWKGVENNFHNSVGPVKLIHACLCVRMNTESSFHHCGHPAKLLQTSLCVRKDVEIIFHHCGCPAKLVHPSMSVHRDPKGSFYECGSLLKLWHCIFRARKDLESSFHHLYALRSSCMSL